MQYQWRLISLVLRQLLYDARHYRGNSSNLLHHYGLLEVPRDPINWKTSSKRALLEIFHNEKHFNCVPDTYDSRQYDSDALEVEWKLADEVLR